jgi:imidazoleglycerol-phosphate dehydratase
MIRETNESKVEASVQNTGVLSSNTKTGLAFLDHMINTLSVRSQLGMSVIVQQNNSRLEHVICEDSGITLGLAIREFISSKECVGIEGMGDATACIDEALAYACISCEQRANSFIRKRCTGSRTELVEDMKQSDLTAFVEGLAQGMCSTIWLVLKEGEDPHHTWEAGFRALGVALRKVLAYNSERKDNPACIKGKVITKNNQADNQDD